MDRVIGKQKRFSSRRFSIVLSMLAIAAVLFLPVSHAMAVDADGLGSMDLASIGHDSDHHGTPDGYAGGHCDILSCSFCFPLPVFDLFNVDQATKLTYTWLSSDVRIQRHSPLLRPPRLS